MKLYGDRASGNCYKVILAASLLGLEYEYVAIDILAGDTQTTDFLALNPNGKIPLLQLDDGRCLSESNAIINFLAMGSELYPADPFEQARVLQWQFFEQYSHEPYIAVARFIAKYLGLPEERREEYEAKQAGGKRALSIMEDQLRRSGFICGEDMTVADISLFAYTHVAHEGGFDLAAYPAVQEWIDSIKRLPGFEAM